MKTLIWRLRYVHELRKLLKLPWQACYSMSGSALENVSYDLTESPIDAAQDEFEEWRNCL